MNGRRYLSITLLILAMMVSSCSKKPETGQFTTDRVTHCNCVRNAEPGGTIPVDPNATVEHSHHNRTCQ
jgi:hypothetical protein